jgi:hypothetical protein
MVKKAEVQKKRHPLTPVFGLLLAGGLFAIAYFLSSLLVPKIASIAFNQRPQATIGLAVGIWVFFLALAFFLVAMLAGKDPDDAKQIPLPPKAKDLKKKKR